MAPEERLLDLRLQARRILFSLEDLSIEKQSINDTIVKLRERRARIRKLEAEFEEKFVVLREEIAALEREQKRPVKNSKADIDKL